MSGLDIGAVRVRRDAYRDAFARWLRAGEPDSDRADDAPAAHDAWFAAAVESAADVPELLDQIERDRAALGEAMATVREQAAEIGRLRAELADARFGLTAERDDALQVIADLRGGTS